MLGVRTPCPIRRFETRAYVCLAEANLFHGRLVGLIDSFVICSLIELQEFRPGVLSLTLVQPFFYVYLSRSENKELQISAKCPSDSSMHIARATTADKSARTVLRETQSSVNRNVYIVTIICREC